MPYYPEQPSLPALTAHSNSNYTIVHKFGRNEAVATTFEPVCIGGVYQMPTAATTLRYKAGDATNDTSGAGIRKVYLEGLDETGALVNETISTNGTSAGATDPDGGLTTTTFLRLFRAYATEVGTYGTGVTESHSADVVIENSAGGTDWCIINSADFGRGQSQISAYAIPLGYTGYITSAFIDVDSTKQVDFLLMQRQNLLDVSAPVDALRTVLEFDAVTGEVAFKPTTAIGPFPALTDLVWLGKATAPAEAEIDFEIILVGS